jgi:hypothetical protein
MNIENGALQQVIGKLHTPIDEQVDEGEDQFMGRITVL